MNGKWLSSEEVSAALGSPPPSQLVRAYALRGILLGGLMTPRFIIDHRWAEAIKPTPNGREILDLLKSMGEEWGTESKTAFTLFRIFYDIELLVDYKTSDIDLVRELVSNCIADETLILPHRFGRTLYDRFNDEFRTSRTDHLRYETACELLDGQSQGVYQLGSIVTGPYGLLESASGRYSPPSLKVPLWHCSDTGCKALHSVRLLEHDQGCAGAVMRARQRLREHHGPPSEWANVLARSIRGDKEPRRFYDLPAFLADGLIPKEIDAILRLALGSRVSPQIRQTLDTVYVGEISGSPDEIVDSLEDQQKLQLLLIPSDEDLIWLLDQGVEQGLIELSNTGARQSRQKPAKVTNGDSGTQVGRLGARSTRGNPLARLAQHIWEAYQNNGLLGELKWHLRSQSGNSPRLALMNYLRQSDLEDAVQEFILSNARVTQHFIRVLPGINLTDDRSRDVETIIWKSGFDLPVFPDAYTRLRGRLTAFDEVVVSARQPITEDDMEGIRGIGVNLFVSVEAFIEELLSFQVWLLASDHFNGTQFKYSHTRALQKVPSIIGKTVKSGNGPVAWSSDGKNNLGTLLSYLSATLDWVKDLAGQDSTPLLRPKETLPFFAEDEHLEFPFRHTQLWADCDHNELRAYTTALEDVVRHIGRSRAAQVRNGLDHKRHIADYPNREEMRSAVYELRDALNIADAYRLLPKPYWLDRTGTDRLGRRYFKLFDYRRQELILHSPSLSWLSPDFSFQRPTIIAPGNLLGLPNGEITFYFLEETSYDRYWEGYPRRRKIPPEQTNEVSENLPSQETSESSHV